MSPPRIALFTMESAFSSQAIVDFIKRNQRQIGLVVLSGPSRVNTRRALKGSLAFSIFLTFAFIVYPWYLRILEFPGTRTRSIRRVCRDNGIPCIRTADVNHPGLHQQLRKLDISLLVTCLFDQILESDLIQIPAQGCINIHPGLLPECRGVFPEVHTAAGACTGFGFTLHWIENTGIDRGGILYREVLEPADRTILEISRFLFKMGLVALEGTLGDLGAARGATRPQGEGNYYSYPGASVIKRMKTAGFRLW